MRKQENEMGDPQTGSTQSGTPTEELSLNNINVGREREGSDRDLLAQVTNSCWKGGL